MKIYPYRTCQLKELRNRCTVIQENTEKTQEVAELPDPAKDLSESTESTCPEELSESKPNLSVSSNTDEHSEAQMH